MVSGRPLGAGRLPDGLSRDGSWTWRSPPMVVYVLDAAGLRLLSMRPKELPSPLRPAWISRPRPALRRREKASCTSRTSAASHGSTPGRATRSRCARAASPAGVCASPLECRCALGVERLEDGTCRIVRVRVDPATARARSPQVLASGIAIPAPSAVSVSDDAVYYVSRDEDATAGRRDTWSGASRPHGVRRPN